MISNSENNFIKLRGARQHNLKDISIDIPKNSFTIITGVSGSGKSSLAFDTIYAEGQRRYVESLSSHIRQFLSQMEKPDIDSIDGLSPSIAIEQHHSRGGLRSTVATATEIYDYLRILFAKAGVLYCPACKEPISYMSVDEMVDIVMAVHEGAKLYVIAPMYENLRYSELSEAIKKVVTYGFNRVIVNDGEYTLESADINFPTSDLYKLSIVVDRLVIQNNIHHRLADSLEMAIRLGAGIVKIKILEGKEFEFNSESRCRKCGKEAIKPTPQLFSFNSPHGACKTCKGLGLKLEHKKNVKEISQLKDILKDVTGLDSIVKCPACGGARISPEAKSVLICGKGIHEICAMPVSESKTFMDTISFPKGIDQAVSPLRDKIVTKLGFLEDMGLNYLTLDRTSSSLSGGEAQRIRLAAQIGSSLSGILYVLDEPSIGLHPRDNAKLIYNLKKLRDIGNTVIVVEHDYETVMNADYIIDMGPGAGECGGHIVAYGTPEQIMDSPDSVTGHFLSGMERIEIPVSRRSVEGPKLKIIGASEHNLKNIDVEIPLGTITCITGVSGSGKSTLMNDVLYPYLMRYFYNSKAFVGQVKEIKGTEYIDKVVSIDQNPIGRTLRSNPATYAGIFTHLRELFATLPEARKRGYKSGRFSFNARGGRCEHCAGEGEIRIDMHFLPNVFVKCEACNGSRYNRETLEVRYKGFNIHDVLLMNINQAYSVFNNIPVIKHKLETLIDVGLGYITLGQLSTSLSGGEAQRIKLAKELSRMETGKTIYLMDEPTTGLHFSDIKKLISVLDKLVNLGNTVVVIEHNLDIIKVADFIIDIGPESGDAGGYVVGTGPPEKIISLSQSHTGHFLSKLPGFCC